MANWQELVGAKTEQFRRNVEDAIRTLLQQRHLYQSVLVARTDVYFEPKPKLVSSAPPPITALGAGRGGQPVPRRPDVRKVQGQEKELRHMSEVGVDGDWRFDPPNLRSGNMCHVRPPDVKLFCSTCERVEAYNLVFVEDVLQKADGAGFLQKGVRQQAFLFAYRCQSCKGTPEMFLVRRRGLRLTNEGRSPIERVDVPPYVPKPVKRFLGGAIVAHQSGQTLAGLFLLRTAIEQWARGVTSSTKEQADQVLEEYMATLPDDFKQRFASMKALYGELSADIHGAIGNAALFDKALAQIVEHFDARRMFKMA